MRSDVYGLVSVEETFIDLSLATNLLWKILIGQIYITEVAILVRPDVWFEMRILIHRQLFIEMSLRRAEYPWVGIALREQQIVEFI